MDKSDPGAEEEIVLQRRRKRGGREQREREIEVNFLGLLHAANTGEGMRIPRVESESLASRR